MTLVSAKLAAVKHKILAWSQESGGKKNPFICFKAAFSLHILMEDQPFPEY